MKRILLFLTALFPLVATLQGADSDSDPIDKPPLPRVPLPARAPDYASWQITYISDKKDSDSAAPGDPSAASPVRPAQIKQITVTKTRTTYHREEITDRGPGPDVWWMNGFLLTRKKGGPYSFSDGNDGNIEQIDYQNTDFPELEWINADCYMGVVSLDGVKCLLFTKQIPLESQAMLRMPPDQQGGPTVEASAWLNLETRLPVQTTIAGRSAGYLFLSPPTEALSLPPEGLKQIQVWQSEVTALRRPPVQP